MNSSSCPQWIAFSGNKRISSGTPKIVVSDVKHFIDSLNDLPVLIFEAKTSELIEMDFRGALSDVLERLPVEDKNEVQTSSTLPAPPKLAAGRPKLGVVAREVTLLPRHWDWLASQPGGASVTLRKLVEQTLRASKEADQLRLAQEATYKFMTAMAGDYPGFEEASRALFAGNIDQFRRMAEEWHCDVRDHLFFLADATHVVHEEND